MTPQEMLDRLLGPHGEDHGRIANDLLSEIGKRFSVESLHLLLTSKQKHSRASGAFIAAETLCDLHALMGDLVALLDDEPRICADAIEAIGNAARPEDRDALGRILLCLAHFHPLPRYKAIQFFRFCPLWKLERACQHVQFLNPGPAFLQLSVLMKSGRDDLPSLVSQLLLSPEPIIVRFGLALAARPYPTIVDSFLEQAARNDDPEIVDLARRWQKNSNPRLNSPWHFWHSDMPD